MFSLLIADLMAFTVLEWAFCAGAILFLVLSIVGYSNEKYGTSFVLMLVSILGLGFLGKASVIEHFQTVGIFAGVIKPIIYYVLIGFVVSFVNWVFFCMHAKTKYRNHVLRTLMDGRSFAQLKQNIAETMQLDITAITDDFARKVLQLQVATHKSDSIFGRSYKANFDVFSYSNLKGQKLEDASVDIDKRLAEILPPRALRGVVILTSAVFEWPITILSLLFSRLLTVIVDKVVFASRKLVDAVAHISFGSTDVKL